MKESILGIIPGLSLTTLQKPDSSKDSSLTLEIAQLWIILVEQPKTYLRCKLIWNKVHNKYQKSSLIDSCCQELFQKSFDLLLHFLCSNLLPIDSTKMSNISLMQFLLNLLLFDIEVNVITNLLKHQINR